MDLLQLRYFRAVARKEHISRAAEELRVAQPSLSRTIARLEDELGVPLFDRKGRRIVLNRYGAAFLDRVERALRELDDGRRELAELAGFDAGDVAIASETLLSLTALLTGFVKAHPGVRVGLRQAAPAEMSRWLREGVVHVCMASQPLTGPGLTDIAQRATDRRWGVRPGDALRQENSGGDHGGLGRAVR
ncbi:MAG TPA: LysR family transcriptional regulator, partial [Phytomonospora sp.]